MKFSISRNTLLLGFVALLSVAVTSTNADKSAPTTGNFRVVLDSPRGNDKKTRLMLKNRIQSSVADVDLKAMVERAKKEFKTIEAKTKQISEEAREIVDQFKENLQHYTRKEIGIYAALTVALTVTLKSKKSSVKIHPFICFTLLRRVFRLPLDHRSVYPRRILSSLTRWLSMFLVFCHQVLSFPSLLQKPLISERSTIFLRLPQQSLQSRRFSLLLS